MRQPMVELKIDNISLSAKADCTRTTCKDWEKIRFIGFAELHGFEKRSTFKFPCNDLNKSFMSRTY